MKNIHRYSLLALCLLPLIGGSTFAAGVCDSETTSLIVLVIQTVVKFFSWGWVVLASLAGKLMSNELVYGSFINLDVYLWKLRNLTKNIANFFLGFYFLYMILNSFFDDKGAQGVLSKVPKFMIAGVVIQASWFLFAVLIDLSTLATAAVGSLPGVVISDNEGYQRTISELSATPQRLTIDPENKKNPISSQDVPNVTTDDNKALYDSIMPRADSIAGPLVFLGASIFKFQDFSFLSNDKTGCSSITLVTILNFFILIFFMLPLLILVVVNVIRIFYLWIFIAFSPFIVIFQVFSDSKDGIFSLKEKLDLGEILKLIFQPVVMVGAMSLLLIIVLALFQAMGKTTSNVASDNFEYGNMKISSLNGASTIAIANLTTVQVDGELFNTGSRTVGGMFGDLLLYGFVLILLWLLVSAISFTSKFTKTAAESVTGIATRLIGSLPVIPFAGQMMNLRTMTGNGQFKDSIAGKALEGYQGRYETDMYNRFDKKLDDALGLSEDTVLKNRLVKKGVDSKVIKQNLSWDEGSDNKEVVDIIDGRIEMNKGQLVTKEIEQLLKQKPGKKKEEVYKEFLSKP